MCNANGARERLWRASGNKSAMIDFPNWKISHKNCTRCLEAHTCVQERIQRGDRPPKPTKVNIFTMIFYNFTKHHSRLMVILPSIVLPQQCCEVSFISYGVVLTMVVKYPTPTFPKFSTFQNFRLRLLNIKGMKFDC